VQKALQFHKNARKAPDGEVELQLGERFYSPVEITAMLLEQLKQNAGLQLGEEVTHAVITVPACFSQRQKNATRQAARLAGLKVLRIINEPTAAALAFGMQAALDEPQHVLVFGLGGGAFDVSILLIAAGNFDVLHVDGDAFLGGEDIDRLIVEKILQNIRELHGEDLSQDQAVLNRLKDLAERAKIDLSREEYVRIVAPDLAASPRGGLVGVDLVLARPEFEALIAGFVQEAIAITHRALDKAGLGVDDIRHVLLAGGSTRIPLVRRRLKEIFGDRIETGVDPLLCAGLGAAVQTAIPIEWVCAACKAVNDGMQESCTACGARRGDLEDAPHILCEMCRRPNQQGRLHCWNCGAQVGAAVAAGAPDGGAIHVCEVTSTHLGVEIGTDYEGAYSRLEIILPRGTPYPTHQAFRAELYTTQAVQTVYRLPVYEVESEEAGRKDWEHVGEVVNEKAPPGIPANTPVVVEMRVDGDGILTVASSLRRLKGETSIDHRFDFGSAQAKRPRAASADLELLDFLLIFLAALNDMPVLKKYCKPASLRKAQSLAGEVKRVIESGDAEKAKELAGRVRKFTAEEVPPPVWDVFVALWCVDQAQVSAIEKGQANLTIQGIDRALSAGDMDNANRHLQALRQQNAALLEKIPNQLLMAAR
jgi:molecular chaperone DnaK